MKTIPKNILLIGVGWFGKNHLKVWQALEGRGRAHLVGIVERDERMRRELREKQSAPVFTTVNVPLLKRVDAVDIVTPTPTHFALVKKCLRYTNVFVEKPLAEKVGEADELSRLSRRYGRVLAVGHIFRFHPTVHKLRLLFAKTKRTPRLVTGRFISPIATWKGKTTALDNLHFFDILDCLFNETPAVVRGRARGSVTEVALRYPSGMKARFLLGWRGAEKERVMIFHRPGEEIHCDFKRNIVNLIRGKQKRMLRCVSTMTPLEAELTAFLRALDGGEVSYADGAVGARIIAIANQADTDARQPRGRSRP